MEWKRKLKGNSYSVCTEMLKYDSQKTSIVDVASLNVFK